MVRNEYVPNIKNWIWEEMLLHKIICSPIFRICVWLSIQIPSLVHVAYWKQTYMRQGQRNAEATTGDSTIDSRLYTSNHIIQMWKDILRREHGYQNHLEVGGKIIELHMIGNLKKRFRTTINKRNQSEFYPPITNSSHEISVRKGSGMGSEISGSWLLVVRSNDRNESLTCRNTPNKDATRVEGNVMKKIKGRRGTQNYHWNADIWTAFIRVFSGEVSRIVDCKAPVERGTMMHREHTTNTE